MDPELRTELWNLMNRVALEGGVAEVHSLVKEWRAVVEKVNVGRFQVGEVVAFRHNGRLVVGNVLWINEKTVTVKSDDGRRWRVPPTLLVKAKNENNANGGVSKNLLKEGKNGSV